MDALDALQSRVSVAVLGEPGPSDDQIQSLLKSAIRAPDHGLLRPWRFLLLKGKQREALGDIFVEARMQEPSPATDQELNKLRTNPLRAPLVMVVVAEVIETHKVPVIEQVVATGAAVQNMMIAAHAMGIGAMWRTGPMASNKLVKAKLGFADKDEIVGFLYLGTPSGSVKALPSESPETFIRELPDS